MKWTKLTSIISAAFNEYIKKYLVSFVMRAIGVSGGFLATALSFIVGKLFSLIKSKAESAARIKDQENLDKKINDEYQKDLIEQAPEEKLIEDETNILNGGRKP